MLNIGGNIIIGEKMELNHIKYGLAYPDGSGNRMSLEIDTKKEDSVQCRINDSAIMCSIKDLEWLRDAISDAIFNIRKINKNEAIKQK